MHASGLRSSLLAQVVFVVLLTTCLGMVVFWVLDHSRYSSEMTDALLELYAEEADVAAELMATHGLSPSEVATLFPAVEIAPDGTTAVAAERRAALLEDLASRERRYSWEGGFFVFVLGLTLALVGVVLRQRTELLRRQQNFLAAVSHELKSPLASLKLSAETLILRDLDAAGRQRIADRMVQSTARLDTMVANLLNAARLDKGRVDFVPEALRLGEAVEHALAPLASLARGDGLEVTLDVPADLVVRADATAAQLVLVNLLDNALKSVRAQGSGAVRVTAREDGKRVRLDVVDDGLGFEPELADKLFEEFYRAGDELTRRTKGVGLGLHLVRSFVALDGGAFEAASEGPGRGARFSVWWPRSAAPQAREESRSAS